MPTYDITDKESGQVFQAEFQNPPSPQDVDETISLYRSQNEKQSTGRLAALGIGAASSLAPTGGAMAGALGAEELAAPAMVATAEVPPVAAGIGLVAGVAGAIGGQKAVSWLQDKILPDSVKEKVARAHEAHPGYFDAGELAATVPGFRLPSLAKGVGRAAGVAAAGAGIGVGVNALQNKIEGQPTTGEDVVMSALQGALFTSPRFAENFGKSARAALARERAKKILAKLTPEERETIKKNARQNPPPPAETATPPVAPKPPEQTDEQIQERLDQIAETRKAGGLGQGRTREEQRLMDMQAQRKAAPAAPVESPQTEKERLEEEWHYMEEQGASDVEKEKVMQRLKELQDQGVGVDEKAESVQLTPEAQGLIDKHAAGTPVTTDEEAKNSTDPFAAGRNEKMSDDGRPAWADPNTGKIVIHKKNFNDWLESITPDRRDQAVKSLMSEEKIHLATNLADAEKYHKALTPFERWAIRYKYSTPGLPPPKLTDAQWGAEAIRYRMQQLMRMTPTEVAQEYGNIPGQQSAASRRLSIQAVDVLEGIVRRIRTTIKDDGSQAILDRVLQNLEAAKTAAAGGVVQTEDVPFAEQARQHASELKAQADDFRKQGMTKEADELEGMARQASEWAQQQVEPMGGPKRQQQDKNQGLFDDLDQLSRWESWRASINNDRQREKMVADANRKMFKRAQAESGQKPLMEPPLGGSGRGRKKKEYGHYEEGQEIFSKAGTFSRPQQQPVELPGGKTALTKGKAVTLKPGEAPEDLPPVPPGERALASGQQPRLPNAEEVESAAASWVWGSLYNAPKDEGGKLPDLEDFRDYMRRNYQVQPGQATQYFEEQLGDFLENASGEKLQGLLKAAFGPESILGRMRVPDAVPRREGFNLEAEDPQKEAQAKEEQMDRPKGRQELTSAEAMQQRRGKAMALLFNKAMGARTASDPSLLSRKEVLPSEVMTGVRFGTGGVEKLGPQDEHDPELGERLYENSRRSSSDKASITRRILVLRDRNNNSVHQVSAWKNVHTRKGKFLGSSSTVEKTFVTNPALPRGEGLELKDAVKRYRLLETYALREPVEKFHKRFGSEKQYDEKFGNEAKQFSESAAAYDPNAVPMHEFVEGTEPEGTEGIEEGGTGFVMGPHKAEVTGALGIGKSAFEEARGGARITEPEADAVRKALEGSDSVKDVEGLLKGLSKEEMDKVRQRWHQAAAKLQKAQASLAEAEAGASSPPEDAQTEKLEAKVEEGRKRLRAAQYEAARATSDFLHQSQLRSGVAKIARRFQSLYGTKTVSEFDDKGQEYKAKRQVPTEDLLHSMAKSLFSASLKGVLRPDPLAAIKSLGGFKDRPSPWDKTVLPSGRELTMLDRRPPTDTSKSEFQGPIQKSPAPPDAMQPAPLKPIETLTGEDFKAIEQSVMTPQRRIDSEMNIVRFNEGELGEIMLYQHYFPLSNEAISKISEAREIEESKFEKRLDPLKKHPKQKAEIDAKAKSDFVSNFIKQAANKPELAGKSNKQLAALALIEFDKMVKAQPTQQPLFARGRYLHEAISDEASYLKMVGLSWLERSPLKQLIAAGFDSYHTVARNFAMRKGNGVRLLATEKGRENKQMLGGAIAMHATDAFDKNFIYDQDALNEFYAMEKDNPDVKLAHLMLTGTPHDIKLELSRMIAQEPRGERAPYFKGLIGEINQAMYKDREPKELESLVAAQIEERKRHDFAFEPNEQQMAYFRFKAGEQMKGDQNRKAMTMVRLKGARMLREANRKIENDLLQRGWLTHAGAEYRFNPDQKHKLDNFSQIMALARSKAENLLNKGTFWERRAARDWLNDIKAHQADVDFARAHWDDPQLRAVTERAARELDAMYDRETAGGSTLSYNDAYLPGRYDGQYYNHFSVVFGPQVMGRRYSKGKAYKNYYEASADAGDVPNIAATHDISNLVEHRVRQGMVNLGKNNWHQSLYNIKDPVEGIRAFAEAKRIPGKDGYIPDLKGNESERDYVAVSPDAGRKPIFALRGSYERLLKQLVSPSAIDQNIIGRMGLQASQTLKHIALVGDFFHLSRLHWYAGSIMGRKGLNFWRGANFIPGWAALDIEEKDLPQAVRAGIVGRDTAQWLTGKIPFQAGGFKSTISRMEAANEFEKVGFNVGQISDAIYKDLVRRIPVLGWYNNLLFTKVTRGLMMRSALSEYERLAKSEPGANSTDLMRRIGHDLNNYFGSIGKQGWIKSSTWQDAARIMFLSPQWVEGLIKKDMAIPYKGITSLKDGLPGLYKTISGHDTIARGVLRGMIGMFALTQVVNLITRRQPTWQNEEGHKWDADIGENVWINPLSVFNEITHGLIQYGESKEKFWDAIRQVGENKLGFVGRGILVAATDQTPTGEYLTSNAAVAKGVAGTMAPTPLTLGPLWQKGASVASGGRIDPPRGADMRRSMAALAGIKAQVGQKLESQMGQMARQFVKANKLSHDSEERLYTDEPSYSKLRQELVLGNEVGARGVLDGLRKNGVTEKEVIEAMSRWLHSSYTGSRRNEVLWLHSLKPEELAMYRQAIQARQQLYQQWLRFYLGQQASATP